MQENNVGQCVLPEYGFVRQDVVRQVLGASARAHCTMLSEAAFFQNRYGSPKRQSLGMWKISALSENSARRRQKRAGGKGTTGTYSQFRLKMSLNV